MKIAISIGHHPERPGITNGQYTEHSEMAPIAGLLIQSLIYQGHKPYVIQAGPLGEKIEQVNRLGADLAIELHLNAGGGTGAESLYCPGSEKGREYASIIQRNICRGFSEGLGTPVENRGVKEGWFKMKVGGDKDAFLANTNCPACITEMYFLDDKDAVKIYAGNLEFYRVMALYTASAVNTIAERIAEEKPKRTPRARKTGGKKNA